MSSLFNKNKKFPLNPKDIIAIKDALTGKIVNAEIGSILGQMFDLSALGQQCIQYEQSTTTDCETGDTITLPLQIVQVLIKHEAILCQLLDAIQEVQDNCCDNCVTTSTSILIYNENVGEPTEFNTSIVNANSGVLIDDGTDPDNGNIHISFNGVDANTNAEVLFESTSYIVVDGLKELRFSVIHTASTNEYGIKIAFLKDGQQGTHVINVLKGLYGFSMANSGYNEIVVPLFTDLFSDVDFDSILLSVTPLVNGETVDNVSIDNISLVREETVCSEDNIPPTVDAGANQTITLTGISATTDVTLTATASDPDGTIVSYLWEQLSGTPVSIDTPNTASATPNDLPADTYVFQVTVTDNDGATATDTVTIIVQHAVVLPTVSINDVAVLEGGSLVFTVSLSSPATSIVNLILNTANFGTADASDYVSSTSIPANILVGQSSVQISVATIQDSDLEPNETFTVTGTVTSGNTANTSFSGTGTILNDDANNPPTAVDDNFSTNQNTAISGNVLTNDFDIEGDSFTVVSNTNPSNGVVTINTAGNFTYTPNPLFSGTDTFTYTISEVGNLSNTATATVTITVSNNTFNITETFDYNGNDTTQGSVTPLGSFHPLNTTTLTAMYTGSNPIQSIRTLVMPTIGDIGLQDDLQTVGEDMAIGLVTGNAGFYARGLIDGSGNAMENNGNFSTVWTYGIVDTNGDIIDIVNLTLNATDTSSVAQVALGDCSNQPTDLSNWFLVHVDNIAVVDGDTIWANSQKTTPFNGGGQTYMIRTIVGLIVNRQFDISSTGIVSNMSICDNFVSPQANILNQDSNNCSACMTVEVTVPQGQTADVTISKLGNGLYGILGSCVGGTLVNSNLTETISATKTYSFGIDASVGNGEDTTSIQLSVAGSNTVVLTHAHNSPLQNC